MVDVGQSSRELRAVNEIVGDPEELRESGREAKEENELKEVDLSFF